MTADTVPPSLSSVAGFIAGAMADGISIYWTGREVTWHGPSEARKRWAARLHLAEASIADYLSREIWPANGSQAIGSDERMKGDRR